MNVYSAGLNASEAAARLGVSTKALRLYEQSGLLVPQRTAAGYRRYRDADMARASKVVILRKLGLSLAQVVQVMAGDADALDQALAAHSQVLDDDIRALLTKRDSVRHLRAGLLDGRIPGAAELGDVLVRCDDTLAFDLPWPWAGERFVLHGILSINYIIGSLGSGKTRLSMCIADALPHGRFVGLDRLKKSAEALRRHLDDDPGLYERVSKALAWINGEGGESSNALLALLIELESEKCRYLVVDMVEQELCEATQQAVMRYLRRPAERSKRTLFLMTRSSGILDLSSVLPEESIIYCPANHSSPVRVAPYPNAPGYEAMADCLAPASVRERIAKPPHHSRRETNASV